jgi:GNAT superfamily N-acetyltransferase
MPVRRALAEDTDPVTATICSAFFDDPVWSWVFPDPDLRMAQFAAWWPVFLRAGIPDGTVFVTRDCEAAAVWVAPGAHEMRPDDAARVPELLRELVGDRVDVVLEGLMRFEANHPQDEPHWYLSILATHTAHRGHGLGMGLLAENLLVLDAAGIPAYLESSNPANDERYRRQGFEVVGGFEMPDGPDGAGPHVTTMWRTPR